MAKISKELTYRIVDANLNRATEGIRVCEEVARFILNNHRLTAQFRNLRHRIINVCSKAAREEYIKERNSKEDVGRNLLRGEFERHNYKDLFFANIQRVKESIRVLEEFYKLIDRDSVVKLKRIRYHVYEAEKKTTLKLKDLSNTRQGFLLPKKCH